MKKEFHINNRRRLYELLQPDSLLILFAGEELRRSADAYYPFYADRNFVYLTGIEQKQSVLLAQKAADGTVTEQLYLLPKDAMAERWTGRRLNTEEAEALSGISGIHPLDNFQQDFQKLANCVQIYLDLHKQAPEDIDRPAHNFAKTHSLPSM